MTSLWCRHCGVRVVVLGEELLGKAVHLTEDGKPGWETCADGQHLAAPAEAWLIPGLQ